MADRQLIEGLLALLEADLRYVHKGKKHRIEHPEGGVALRWNGPTRSLEADTPDELAVMLAEEVEALRQVAEIELVTANDEYRKRTVAARQAKALVAAVAP